MAWPTKYLDTEPDAWRYDRDDQRQSLYGDWRLSQTPRHTLHEEVLDGVYGMRNAVHLLVPQNARSGEADLFFYDHWWQDPDFEPFDGKENPPVERLLDPEGIQRPGYVDFPDRGRVVVRLGIRRPRRPDEEVIAACLHQLQCQSDEWHGNTLTKSFYGSCILPHVFDDHTDDPFEWAYRRAKIANGYAVTFSGRDAPPRWIEDPYTKLARSACAPDQEKHATPRTFAVEPRHTALLSRVFAEFPEEILPEVTVFLLSFDDLLREDILREPPVQKFLKALPTMLQNGLLIDRVIECIQRAQENGQTFTDALSFSLRLTEYIYGGEKEPWWFQEDFPLSEEFRSDLSPNEPPLFLEWKPKDMQLALSIAEAAGFAYKEALDLFLSFEREFSSIEHLMEQDAIRLCVVVARDYGIGNRPRALKVMEKACTVLRTTPPDQRSHTLQLLLHHLEDRRPISEITGRLEGMDVSFELPGVTPLIRGLRANGRESDIHSLSVELTHLEDLDAHFREPPQKRLEVVPAVEIQMQTARLLTQVVAPIALLPAPDSREERVGPFTALLRFYEQLRQECGVFSTQVANVYFTYCAQRLPNPFSPPKGFLRIIQRFDGIPDPNYHFDFFEHPNDRAAVRRKNRVKIARRYEILSHLLDASVSGICPWEDIEKILLWMTEEPSQELRERITGEVAQSRKISDGNEESRREEIIAKHRGECLEVIAARLTESLTTRDVQRKDNIALDLELEAGRMEDLPYELRHERQSTPEEEDEHWAERCESEIRMHQDAICKERVLTVAEGIHLLEKLQMLSMAKVVPQGVLVPIAKNLLQGWKEGQAEHIVAPDQHEDDHLESLQMFHRLAAMNIIDVPALEQACTNAQSQEDLRSILGTLSHILLAWKEVEDLMADLELQYTGLAREKTLSETIIQRLEERIRALWGDTPYLVGDALPRLREKLLWFHRFAVASREVKVVSGEAMHYRNVRTDLGRANVLLCKTTAAISALTVCHERQLADQHSLLLLNGHAKAGERDMNGALSVGEGHRADIQRERDELQRKILTWREKAIGLLPVGTKIHVLHEIDDARFRLVTSLIDTSHSGFQLMHANTSLLLPALISAEEMAMIIGFLAQEGAIDLDHPEIQICLPGRLPPDDCAVLGSTLLLATDHAVRFQEEAFCSSHDNETGARMMAYDAGGRRADLPFMTSLSGRTDILGRRSLRDISLYQLLGTVLAHRQAGGPFRDLATPFCDRHREILRKHGLEKVLSASWIVPDESHTRNNVHNRAHFHEAIAPCVEAYFHCAESLQGGASENTGIIFEMRNLLDNLREEIRPIQAQLRDDPEYAAVCKEVLSL